MQTKNITDSLDKVVLLFLVGLLFFASPLLSWIFSATKPWFFIYFVWLVFICLIAISQFVQSKKDV